MPFIIQLFARALLSYAARQVEDQIRRAQAAHELERIMRQVQDTFANHPPRFSVEVRGFDGVEGVFNRLRDKQRLDKALDEAGTVLLNRTRTRYLQEIDPDGNQWPPSKAALQRRLVGGTGTLFNSGNLFHSIQLSKRGDNERVISTDVPYARQHNEGIGQTRRVFLGFSQEDDFWTRHFLMARLSRLRSLL